MKFIKYFTLSIVGAGLLFACDPLADTYEELDQNVTSGASEDISITLTDDDYELGLAAGDDMVISSSDSASMITYKSFSDAQARVYIPYILNEKFPQLGTGSFVNVTYDQYKGGASEVYDYTGAQSYKLGADDYAIVNSDAKAFGFLNNTYTADEYIPSILAAGIQDPNDGDLVAVNYDYANKEYSDIQFTSIYNEDFDPEIPNTFDITSVQWSKGWYSSSYSSDFFAKISGYNDGVNEDYLITPEIDLSGQAGAILNVSQAVNYGSGFVLGKDLAVLISTDYAGDATAATWTTLELDQWPAGDSYDFVDGKVDLSAYEGQKIRIAFYYTCTADGAATWEINNVAVEIGEAVPTDNINTFYQYSSSDTKWEKFTDGVYYLGSADYNAMGDPGQYDNFSSSLPPDNYIVDYLSVHYPYAQEEEQIVVVYKYYSSGSLQTRGNLYTFMDGAWTAYTSVQSTLLLFAFEDGKWLPDNTIKYTLTAADYTAIADNKDLATQSARDNLAKYGNFNTYNWSQAEILAAINFVIMEMDPGADEGQKYQITYDTYPGGIQEVKLILKDGVYVENK